MTLRDRIENLLAAGHTDAEDLRSDLRAELQPSCLPPIGDPRWRWQAGKTKGSWVAAGAGDIDSNWGVFVAGIIIDVSYSDGGNTDLFALLPAPEDPAIARRMAESVALAMAEVLAAVAKPQ